MLLRPTPKESPGAMQLAAGANSILRITNALYTPEYDGPQSTP
jgi:hypothetical protein